jgi:hypothetical protein
LSRLFTKDYIKMVNKYKIVQTQNDKTTVTVHYTNQNSKINIECWWGCVEPGALLDSWRRHSTTSKEHWPRPVKTK